MIRRRLYVAPYFFLQLTAITMMKAVRPIRSLATSTTTTSTTRSASSLVPSEYVALIESLTDHLTTSSEKKTYAVYNPAAADLSADDAIVASHVPVMGQQDALAAIGRSAAALPRWRDGTTATARAAILTKWSAKLKEHADGIAAVMTLESGKPIQESRGEVAYAASFLDYYAGEAVRPSSAGGGFLVPTPFSDATTGNPRGQVMAMQQAVGVSAMITPWNFPAAMITRKVGPAFAAGCTAVVKPSELTPLTALYMHKLALEAGLPDGVLEMVTADSTTAPEVGKAFCSSSTVRKVSFTGSTAVGKALMKQSSETMQRLSLELGGNAPFVVFEDADIDQAVQAAVASKFRNAGQTCVCADRFLVAETVHDEFVEKFRAKVEAFVVGNGMDPSVNMGPLISTTAVSNVDTKVKEALNEGAVCVTGGTPLKNLGPQFYAPTILTNVDAKSRVWAQECFGPVAAIRSFATEEEALEIANDSSVGLASYFCTRDLSRAFRFSKSLECGLVGLNEGIISTCAAPFGGVKESGLGREGSPLGINEYLETKYVFMNV